MLLASCGVLGNFKKIPIHIIPVAMKDESLESLDDAWELAGILKDPEAAHH